MPNGQGQPVDPLYEGEYRNPLTGLMTPYGPAMDPETGVPLEGPSTFYGEPPYNITGNPQGPFAIPDPGTNPGMGMGASGGILGLMQMNPVHPHQSGVGTPSVELPFGITPPFNPGTGQHMWPRGIIPQSAFDQASPDWANWFQRMVQEGVIPQSGYPSNLYPGDLIDDLNIEMPNSGYFPEFMPADLTRQMGDPMPPGGWPPAAQQPMPMQMQMAPMPPPPPPPPAPPMVNPGPMSMMQSVPYSQQLQGLEGYL